MMFRSLPRLLGLALGWLLLTLGGAWACGALLYDFPIAAVRGPLAVVFLAGALAVLIFVRPRRRAKLAVGAAVVLILAWWFTLQPRNDRSWQPDVAQTAWAEMDGDTVTLHNFRNCD